MKETVFDVLMYLFNHYLDEDSDLNVDEEFLRKELMDAGFSEIKIGKALGWLEGLSTQEGSFVMTTDHALRIYTHTELERINLECRGFLLFLEQMNVLDHITREFVIDRIMALETVDIDLDLEQLKWIVLMVLFNRPGQEGAVAWMEDLVFNETSNYLH